MSELEINGEELAAKGFEAKEREDWVTSLHHWSLFHALYPFRPDGYLHAGESLWRLGQFAAADDMLTQGMERFPDNEDLILSYAWAALDRRNWAEAEKRFGAALDRFSKNPGARFGIALARRELGRLDEAEAVLLQEPDQAADLPSRQLLAELATSLGNFPVAIERWEALLGERPENPDLHIGYLDCLRSAKRLAEADRALAAAALLFPDNEQIALGSAWNALEKRDWAQAEAQFRAALERLPGSMNARMGAALALRELGRLEEAETILLDGDNPEGEAPVLQLLAELATDLGRFDIAVARWKSLLTLNSLNPALHVSFVECLRAAKREKEADEALQATVQLFPKNMTVLRMLAEMAEQAGDWPLALRRWDTFKTAYGSLPEGYIGAAYALVRLGRLDDAEVVMTPAARLFSENPNALALFADIATDAGRWTEAAARWRAVQKLAPRRAEGFLGEATALTGAGHLRESEDLLARTLERFPSDLEVACRYAAAPVERGASAEAIERWRAVVQKFPREARPRSELVRCLTAAREFAAAEATAQEALALLPGNVDVLLAQAENATYSGDARLAETRWAALVKAAPGFWAAPVGYARQLLRVGEAEKAIAVLEAAAPRFRSDLSFNLNRAKIISELEDWPRALSIWAEIWPQAGGNGAIRSEIDRVVSLASHDLEIAAAESPGAPPPFVIPPILLRNQADESRERETTKALMMRFESLGDTCEFGTVQRRFGAEPLSLFRWTGTPPDRLAAAFRAGLVGVGEPEYTVMEVVNGEYVTTDTRYHMFSHTFTMETAAPRAKFYSAQCKRMRFLREKLLQDLVNPEKIFVYGSARLDDQRIDELFDAIRSLGPRITLLCVRVADAEHPAGAVKFRREGLLVGGIRGFSTVDIAIDEWLQICRAAAAMTAETLRQVA